MLIARSIFENGKQFLLLGLSRENIRRLQADEPIRLTRETHGDRIPQGWVIGILFGETERDMEDQLRKGGFISEQTKTYIDPRLK